MYSARKEPGTSKMTCGSHVPCVASMDQYDIGYKYSTFNVGKSNLIYCFEGEISSPLRGTQCAS